MLMPRILFKLVLIFSLTFVTLTFSARGLGNTQPSNTALAGFSTGCGGKAQPCWFGIVVGETSMDDVKTIMTQYNHADELPPATFRLAYQLANKSQVFFDSMYNRSADRIILRLANHVSIGEMLGALGMPDWIIFRSPTDPISYIYQYETADLQVVLLDNQLDFLNPHRNVSVLLIISSLVQPVPTFAFHWHGFVPFWRYCQVENRNLGLC